jgi:death-on-curing protein
VSTEPGWIELSEVVALNKGAVTITREQHLLINPGTLESAVMSPRNLFQCENEDDVGVLACRLIVALSRAHAFIQGNKRTAWLSGVMFQNINGYDIVLPSIQANQFIGEEMTKVIKRDVSEAEFLGNLDPFIVTL